MFDANISQAVIAFAIAAVIIAVLITDIRNHKDD